MSTVKRRPEDLAPNGILTVDHGTRLSIPCNVTRPEDDGTTVVYHWYRDGASIGTLPPDKYGAGSLVLESVGVADRGRYTCVVEISASGVEAQPLPEEIGSLTVGVGGTSCPHSIPDGMEWSLDFWAHSHSTDPPISPLAPTAPSVAMVTANTLTLGWTPPTFSGNLPLTGYLVEVLLLGNYLCLQVEPEWELHQSVDEGGAVGAVVEGLVPFQEYMVRIRARNSAYTSPPSLVPGSVWTLPGS